MSHQPTSSTSATNRRCRRAWRVHRARRHRRQASAAVAIADSRRWVTFHSPAGRLRSASHARCPASSTNGRIRHSRVDGMDRAAPWALAVAPGKHGADTLVRGHDGQARASRRDADPRAAATRCSSSCPTRSGRRLRLPKRPHDAGEPELAPMGSVNAARGDRRCEMFPRRDGAGCGKNAQGLRVAVSCAAAFRRRCSCRNRMGPFGVGPAGRSVRAPGRDRAGDRSAGETGRHLRPTWRQQGWLHLRSDPATWRPLAGPASA